MVINTNRWRHSNAETLADVADTVTRSSRSGHNIPQLVADEVKPVKFFHWKPFLERYFKRMKHITKYHHFAVDGILVTYDSYSHVYAQTEFLYTLCSIRLSASLFATRLGISVQVHVSQ